MESSILSLFGSTEQDIALMLICPVAAMLGSFIHALVLDNNFNEAPKLRYRNINKQEKQFTQTARSLANRSWWYLSRLILGGFVGMIVPVYFASAIQPNIQAASKVVFMAVLLGYCAPNVLETINRRTQTTVDKFAQQD